MLFKRNTKIRFKHSDANLFSDVMSLSAKELEESGVYVERINFINNTVFKRILAFYKERDLFWRIGDVRDGSSGMRYIRYHGLFFCMTEVIVEEECLHLYSIHFFTASNAPENQPSYCTNITPKEYHKIENLQAMGSIYVSNYRLMSTIFRRHQEDILYVELWEKFKYYDIHLDYRLNEIQKLDAIKSDKGLPSFKESSFTYSSKNFMEDNGSSDYVGDGLRIAPNGDMTDEGS